MKKFTIYCQVEIEAKDLSEAQQVIDRILINNSIREFPDPWIEEAFKDAVVEED